MPKGRPRRQRLEPESCLSLCYHPLNPLTTTMAMTPNNELIRNLREEISTSKRVLVIVGAGVSMSATKGHEHASWTGLLKSGIERCLTVAPPLPEGWEERCRGLIDSGNLEDLLSAADEIANQLGEPDGGEYSRWLRETVGSLPLLDRTVLDALRDLPVTLATTNYDDLLERVTGLEPVTWRNPAKFQRVLRGDEPGIVHLHGFGAEPTSVVLSRRSYKEILGNEQTQGMLKALRFLGTLIFVGCGEGLNDPNFSAFRRWSSEIFHTSEARHFRLCLDEEVLTVRAQHPPGERIFAVPYGPNHKSLGPFLRTLAPVPTGRAAWLPISIMIALVAVGGSLWWRLDTETLKVPKREPIFSVEVLKQSKVPLPRPSLAVMTFENRSGDGDLDWLSTALAEAVSAKLGITGDVRVADRYEASLAEIDLLLARPGDRAASGFSQAEASPQNLLQISRLLGVSLILGGDYDRESETSPIRLTLRLYDAADGHVVVQTRGEGEPSAWLDLVDRSTGDLPGFSLRQKVKPLPLTPPQKESLRALFPITPSAAKLYAQGLDRYYHFDTLSASDLFGRSARLESHPLVLAALANTLDFLGRSQESREAIQRAEQLENQVRKTSRALPERYRSEIEILQRKIASDQKEAAAAPSRFFREFFADDINYGLLATQALVNARSTNLANPLLKELRLLPLAELHPGLDRLEASALTVRQNYKLALYMANRSISKAQFLGAIREESLARLQLASTLSSIGRRTEAETQLWTAMAGFHRIGDRLSEAQCFELAAILAGLDLRRAQNLYKQAISRYDDLGAQRDKEIALLGLRAVLTQAGEISEAEEISKKTTAVVSSPEEEGTKALQKGALFYLAGNLQAAKEQWEAAKRFLPKDEQPDYHAMATTNLGEIELMRGNLAAAVDHHYEALNAHKDLPSEVTPYDQVCLGRVYMLTGEYPAARDHLDEALRWLKFHADHPLSGPEGEGGAPPDATSWTEALLAMAELELLTGHAEKSEERVRDVLGRAVQGLKPVRARVLSLRARRLLSEGKFQPAWKAVSKAEPLARGDFRAVREVGITKARVLAALGKVDQALKELDVIAAESAKTGQVVYVLESTLAAGEIEQAQFGRGRHRLETLRERAEALHFGQIVQRVDLALKE